MMRSTSPIIGFQKSRPAEKSAGHEGERDDGDPLTWMQATDREGNSLGFSVRKSVAEIQAPTFAASNRRRFTTTPRRFPTRNARSITA